MVDATEGFQSQEQSLFHLCDKNSKGIVIVVNKWDLIVKDTKSTLKFTEEIKEKIAPFRDVPIIFTSVVEKQRIFKAIETAIHVYERRQFHIPTHELNEFILSVIEQNPPPSIKGKYVKIKYATQLKSNQQIFLFFCNLPQYVNENYKRFIENKIREKYDYEGVPIQIFFRKK